MYLPNILGIFPELLPLCWPSFELFLIILARLSANPIIRYSTVITVIGNTNSRKVENWKTARILDVHFCGILQTNDSAIGSFVYGLYTMYTVRVYIGYGSAVSAAQNHMKKTIFRARCKLDMR